MSLEKPETISFLVNGVPETRAFAERLLPLLNPGMYVGLSGNLGAGKTEFMRQLIDCWGGGAHLVCSPTYVLQAIYELRLEARSPDAVSCIHHWDFYRLGSGGAPGEIAEAGSLPGVVTFVEWPDRAEDWNTFEDFRIEFLQGAEEQQRKVSISTYFPHLGLEFQRVFQNISESE